MVTLVSQGGQKDIIGPWRSEPGQTQFAPMT